MTRHAQPAPRWRVMTATGVAMGLVLTLTLWMGGVFAPSKANAAITADDCATALGYPDRTQAQRDWLQLCVDSLRPYVAPTTQPPTASPTSEPTVEPSVSPTVAPTTPPATTEPPAPPVETATYTTSGRFLKDPRGVTVTARGAEQVMWNASWLPNSHITQQALCGSNTIRILPYFTTNTPTGEPKNTLAQIEDQIKRAINGKTSVSVALDGGQKLSTWLRADVKALMFKYQKYITIHAKGESGEGSGAAWVTAANNVVSQMRAAGYTMPLEIMTTTAGRNLPVALQYGQQIVDADPLHRIIIGWQAYWGPGNFYQNQYGMTLAQAFQNVQNANFPIRVGLIKHADQQNGDPAVMNYSALMADAQAKGISWLWWDWRMGQDDLTSNGSCGTWAHDGADIVVNNANGIQHTSVRTPFMLDQSVV